MVCSSIFVRPVLRLSFSELFFGPSRPRRRVWVANQKMAEPSRRVRSKGQPSGVRIPDAKRQRLLSEFTLRGVDGSTVAPTEPSAPVAAHSRDEEEEGVSFTGDRSAQLLEEPTREELRAEAPPAASPNNGETQPLE